MTLTVTRLRDERVPYFVPRSQPGRDWPPSVRRPFRRLVGEHASAIAAKRRLTAFLAACRWRDQACGAACWAIQACMETAAAAPALMERTEPNWEM
ncbi:hypothetical protein B19861_16910 [Bifidobacterium adolescentis]|uniref:Uncharacterized protein n=1 Tax=Bifidobacterium adolescentis TaxID=1680 RepID=A0AAN4VLY8_BIFAD|nr:hypothetical protein B19861_16910 [Bifidobacterium faecale]GJD14202.1 hypothetical protein BIFAD42_11860 [Bifidobacterium adolescentis]